MFFYTNLNKNDLMEFEERQGSDTGQTYSDYKMKYPLKLEYISMHPDDPLEYFTMTSIAPEHLYHSSIEREEIGKRITRFRLHRHSYYELMFVIEGSLYQVIENERHHYTPGSCCLLNKNVLHAEEHSTDFTAAFLDISDGLLADISDNLTGGFFRAELERPATDLDAFLKDNLSGQSGYEKRYVDFVPEKDNGRGARKAAATIDAIREELLNPRIGSTCLIKTHITKLFQILSDRRFYKTTPIQIGTDSENMLFDKIDKIMRDTDGRASRRFLEEELHYSGDYLNKITKKYTGFNIHDFGMSICMGIAARELLTTDRSIGDIAFGLGFSNRTHFYKQFDKIYHTSPAQYRKDQKLR